MLLLIRPSIKHSLNCFGISPKRITIKFGLKMSINSLTTTNMTKPHVVFVLGGPGSGKGTQCAKICKEFNYVHLSAGDLLRLERNTPGSKYGDLIETHIVNGSIVPVEITCSLLEQAMIKEIIKAKESGDHNFSGGKFLIDGFPRNQDNLEGWQRQMNDKVDVKFVLFFDCPKDLCIERCVKRGQAGSGRSDDNPEAMSKRLNTYFNDSLPIINYYDNLNLVRKIDATRTPEEVYDDVRKLFS